MGKWWEPCAGIMAASAACLNMMWITAAQRFEPKRGVIECLKVNLKRISLFVNGVLFSDSPRARFLILVVTWKSSVELYIRHE